MTNTSDQTVIETSGWWAPDGADPFKHWVQGIAAIGNTPFSMPALARVAPNLYHGSYVENLDVSQFDAIVSLYPWEKYDHPNLHEYTMYDDDRSPVDSTTLNAAANKVLELLDDGNTVLVHCQAGLNRSGLLVAYVLILSGWTPDAAIAAVRKKSPAVLVNHAFEAWLRER